MLQVNVDVNSIIEQKVERDRMRSEKNVSKVSKVEFNTNHYLNTRLAENETEKEIVIRILPFTKDVTNPFKSVHVHSIKITNEDGKKVWKKFMCPKTMGKSDKCPLCEMAEEAKKRMFETNDEVKKKEFSNSEFMYRVKDYWLVRCIDRAHEDHGVKFWRFPDAKNGKGIYDDLYSLMQSKLKRGVNIYDLYKGKDLIITVTRKDDKMVYHIQDDEGVSSLKEDLNGNPDEATMEKWVCDPMTWEDVYSVKDYDYLDIIARGEYPVWSKNLNRWISKRDADKINEEAKAQELQDSLTPQTTDFSSFTLNIGPTKTEQVIEKTQPMISEPEDDGLPF